MSLIIVLDPGHGGEEFHGGEFGPYIEKDIDLTVANVMKSRLEQYDGVTVYLTRESDVPVDLKQRCDIAKAYNADYFVSIHFNLSSLHDLYGSEVWLPIQNKYYNKMYPIANELMNNFDAMGLHNRGIKTRVGSGGDNYYAVIKYATNYGIPSCIIEHCHMDNPNDNWIIPSSNPKAMSDALYNFGTQDADAFARALHLKSTILGVDYSKFKTTNSTNKSTKILPDNTEPEVNNIELQGRSGNIVTLKMKAEDKNGFIQYYKYSTDGGFTYSKLFDWPRTSWNTSVKEHIVNIEIPSGANSIVTMVVNGNDKSTISNMLLLPSVNYEAHTSILEAKTLTKTYDGIDFSMLFTIGALAVFGFALIKTKILNRIGKNR
ncbi:MAG: N-acetylmuramoyl-L-alanine amidase [Lachnospiraceae bacterium]|nr:N-acetylmuramoyl-L-alanine amidase [Lachnospiraceae bacterium]